MPPIDVPPELRVLLDRVADVDVPALDRMFFAAALREGLDGLLVELAQVAREEDGYSWADVGAVLNITKQAAQQRLGKRAVLTVTPDGTVTASESRQEYVAGLRAALDALSSPADADVRRLVADALDEAERGDDSSPDPVIKVVVTRTTKKKTHP
jgi:hypothetical protein